MGRPQTLETKQKIGDALRGRKYSKKNHYCKVCGKLIEKDGKMKYCSDECKQMGRVIPTLEKYFDFDSSTIGTQNAIIEYKRIKDTLCHQYWEENLTGRELAELYNYPSYCNITGKLFRYLNIPTRSCRETNKLNILEGKILFNTPKVYKQGWHTTWNGKEVYLRSSYEFDYAEYLDNEKIDYDVESLRIKFFDTTKNEFRCAVPDFHLIDSNTIVEIKSEYTLNKTEMRDKIDAYKNLGYTVKIIVDHKEIEI